MKGIASILILFLAVLAVFCAISMVAGADMHHHSTAPLGDHFQMNEELATGVFWSAVFFALLAFAAASPYSRFIALCVCRIERFRIDVPLPKKRESSWIEYTYHAPPLF